MPNFFLSWAAGEDDDYVEQLFLDLRRQVATLAGRSEPDCGVLGSAPNGLRGWPAGMTEALATCDVFVALCSPRFFLNEVCGKQWWLFAERLRGAGEARPALIALAWTLVDPVPQLTGTVLAPTYGGTRRGVRQLVRLHGLRAEYQAFVADLAGQILAASQAGPPARAEPVPELGETPSAFTLADLRAHRDAAGSPRVHFSVVAGTRDEMERVREDLRFYGPSPQEWAPYLPALPASLADHARAVAADQMLDSDVGTVGKMLDSDVGTVGEVLDRIERAHRRNEIVVLLVDWWTTQMEAYQRVLAELDRRGIGGAAVLVPASRTDAETERNREELRFALGRTFRNSAARPDALFHTEIDTPDRFDADLAGVIEEARNRMFREGPVHRVSPGGLVGDRPLLSGP